MSFEDETPLTRDIAFKILSDPGVCNEEIVTKSLDEGSLPSVAALDEALRRVRTYAHLDEVGQWWPIKPVVKLLMGDRVCHTPSTQESLVEASWLTVAAISPIKSNMRVDVTFTALDGLIRTPWNNVPVASRVIYRPGGPAFR